MLRMKNPAALFLLALILVTALIWAMTNLAPADVSSRFQTFATIFLGIFIEAVPFLVAGSLVSGIIAEFVDQGALVHFVPGNPLAAALIGALLGFAFPVCECGVVPVTRRLYGKGVPLAMGISFLLAAPVINPIVLASTLTAFGWGDVLFWRFGGTLAIAFLVGLLFTLFRPEHVLRPMPLPAPTLLLPTVAVLEKRIPQVAEPQVAEPEGAEPEVSRDEEEMTPGEKNGRWWRALAAAGDDFLDMGRYLVIGSMLAAAMQTIVPQATLVALGEGALLSVIVLMALAFVLSICSTVDAFVALSFVHSFSIGAIVSFLVFGPMVDIKSALMFLGVFRRRAVVLLIMLPLIFSLLLGLLVNLYG